LNLHHFNASSFTEFYDQKIHACHSAPVNLAMKAYMSTIS